MTEAIPLASQIAGADSSGNFGRFLALAHAQNPNVQAYLYETWDYLTVSNWRAQLDSDRALWASIITDVNAAHPGRDVLLIPGGRAMAALHDRIEAGQVPGITNLRDLFTDDVHLTNTGWYFIAMVQYATIFRRSPVGLPAATTNRFGEAIPPPPQRPCRSCKRWPGGWCWVTRSRASRRRSSPSGRYSDSSIRSAITLWYSRWVSCSRVRGSAWPSAPA
ncbi:MAG: hypothetical protein IPH72_19090 [Sandaracinaceae bacterium]|nr:hypothetical protein [Sandaracinaceae bacterium]